MKELAINEIGQVNGGIAPLAIIGIDLALNAVLIGYAGLMLQLNKR